MGSGDRAPIRGTLNHASVVALAIDQDGPLAGVMIEGASGSGKSDLVLRLIEACPWQRTLLVADDSALVSVEGDRIIARPPGTIEGEIEIRGIGIATVPFRDMVRLRAIVRLSSNIRRMPDPETASPAGAGGHALPVLTIDPFQLSAPAKLRYGVRSIVAGHLPAGRQDKPLN
ncbi:aldolase [Parvularcula flava]|uniref:Aldolase n=1 Tax=Aquisalinus luteolus TaxID=1566827 RepID=A0A8J3EPM4_9PROT|nr:aldolase [Aquisalinus luteolus]NHK28539.1 aldolase [Aquisalinus luteolus]GGH98781.1 HPr kinase [Aquisalinus luteolus]